MESIKVFAPATVANVACGFDIFGFAVDNPGDEIILRKKATPGLEIVKIEGDQGRLSLNPEKNTACISMLAYMKHLNANQGVSIELRKKMPLGSGLGSSAASSVAGVFALNELMGRPMEQIDLLPFAMEGERFASGTPHADNVAPSLLGGFIAIRSYEPKLDVIKVDTPAELFATIVHPQIEVNTRDARNILRKETSLKNTITQMGNVAGLVAGLMKGDYGLISRSLVDVIIEPVRSILIPGFNEVKAAAIEAGALGCSISGAGPSMFALSKDRDSAKKVGEAMQRAFASVDIASEIYVSSINQNGPVVIG
ncbi:MULTISPECIES: homoserine kinase [unclassified Siphonobacter]|uniref:homoserine kinase n=1 Tax=unclassified Siphonobacter TaxID=2635712 RepID=UPI000CC08D78|nr:MULTISPECIES: homoserine kinase [unclassified Siphonobacter]MDQ1086301.1 homoserine kinase [Siphonobacter sp. SORGH_AS_1065]MDR6196581.1 homoserine kinase [Siphonobacter sp. SORGH_AS_0500]PKK35798.1 homoserine kinase [Siphonobacter sp. SORGH_AS_0500]